MMLSHNKHVLELFREKLYDATRTHILQIEWILVFFLYRYDQEHFGHSKTEKKIDYLDRRNVRFTQNRKRRILSRFNGPFNRQKCTIT